MTDSITRTWDKENPLDLMTDESGGVAERTKANQALRDYAHLGPARSLVKLLQRYADSAPDSQLKLTNSLDTLKMWSKKYDWQARIAAWDIQEADREELAWEQREKLLRERDWESGDVLRQRVAEFIEQLPKFLTKSEREIIESEETDPQTGVKTITKTKIVTVQLRTNFSQLSRALLTASKMQRLAVGEPTDHIKLSGSALDALIERELNQLLQQREPAATNGDKQHADHD